MPPFSLIDIAAHFSRLQAMFSCLPLKKNKSYGGKRSWSWKIGKQLLSLYTKKPLLSLLKGCNQQLFWKETKKPQKGKRQKWKSAACYTKILVLNSVQFQLSAKKNPTKQLKRASRSECFSQISFVKKNKTIVLIFISGLFSQNGLILSEGAISPEESFIGNRRELFTVQ